MSFVMQTFHESFLWHLIRHSVLAAIRVCANPSR